MLSKLWASIKAFYNKMDPNRLFGLIAMGVITMMFLYWAKSCDSPKEVEYKKQIATWQDSTKKLLSRNDSAEKVYAKIKSVADSQQKASVAQQAQIQQKVQNVNKAIDLANKTIAELKKDTSDCRGICLQWKASAETFQDIATTQKDLLSKSDSAFKGQIDAFGKLTTIYNNRGVEITNLKHQIEIVPVYKPEKFLWVIPLPNRKLSFVAGALLGAVVVHKVSH